MQESVAGIVFNSTNTEVLLIKRRDVPVWVLPGGGIDPGETPELAVCRELFEESGFRVKILRKVALYEPRNKLARRTHFFECTIESGTAIKGSESRDIRFFPIHQLPTAMPPPYAYWIADARQQSPSVLHKDVEGVNYWVFFKLLISHPLLVARFLLSRLGWHYNSTD
ncbi:MAG: NUDIX hydrolase [Anaplasmataceae bacterium]|nr:NUDIX hydrolase [Anaplasmataceae bacterium]